MPPYVRFCLVTLALLFFVAGPSTLTPVRAQTPSAGQILISEFRTRGLSKFDEFIELYNNTNSDLTVPVGSGGWAVVVLGPSNNLQTIFTVPEGTVIPARAHYLGANNNGEQNQNGYQLFDYAVAEADWTGTDWRDNGGVAVFNNNTTFTLATRLDAVGFSGAGNSANAQLLREGAGLAGNFGSGDNTPNNNVQYSFVRRQLMQNPSYPTPVNSPYTVAPQDTNNNTADFIFVSSTGGAFGGLVSKLGFPGPENRTSPGGKDHDLQFTDSALDPNVAISQPPNRVRLLRANCTDCDNTSSNLGKMFMRRRWTNQTDRCVTQLRWRIVEMTTLNNRQANEADIRFLSSAQLVPPSDCPGCNGARVEKEANQALGGGVNSSLRYGNQAGVIDLSASPIAPGQQILTNFSFGVQLGGTFRAFINVEATTTPQLPGGGCVAQP